MLSRASFPDTHTTQATGEDNMITNPTTIASPVNTDIDASLFGAMFAPRPELVAAELLRVCRPGGRIAMGNWTREGFIGQMFKTFARFIAPPGMPSPVLWGDESTVRERFGAHVSSLCLTRVIYQFDYSFSPADVVEFFRQNYGPTTRAFATLGAADQTALRNELVE